MSGRDGKQFVDQLVDQNCPLWRTTCAKRSTTRYSAIVGPGVGIEPTIYRLQGGFLDVDLGLHLRRLR